MLQIKILHLADTNMKLPQPCNLYQHEHTQSSVVSRDLEGGIKSSVSSAASQVSYPMFMAIDLSLDQPVPLTPCPL